MIGTKRDKQKEEQQEKTEKQRKKEEARARKQEAAGEKGDKLSLIEKITGKKNEEPTEREPQFYRSATGDVTVNYKVYYMSVKEKVIAFVLAFLAGAVVGYLCYRELAKDPYGEPTTLTHMLDVIIMAVVGFFSGKLFVPIRNKQILENRQKQLRTQFRDMLEALSTALGAGKNVRESFSVIYDDMKEQYEDDAFIVHELQIINAGLNNGINIEELLGDFGRRSGNGDIQDFADVFDICYRQGGNIKETVRNTCSIISEKMGVAEEIETTVSGSKGEQYVMLVMPVVLVGMIKVSSPDFASNFSSVSGIVSTTIGIVLFVAAYFLGKKLLDIKI